MGLGLRDVSTPTIGVLTIDPLNTGLLILISKPFDVLFIDDDVR